MLILDEPTAGLDPAGAASILANIDAYRQANQATIIIVSTPWRMWPGSLTAWPW